MAFRFTLATVLRVRVVREEHEERLLQQILLELARAQESLREMEAKLSCVTQLQGAETPTAARELHLSVLDVAVLRQWRSALEAQMERLEGLKDEQLVRYREARRDREVLSELRDRQRRAYEAAANKREQRATDDIFIARRLRGGE